ncbi:RnfABCDGE type electron transport complex subunit D [Desulfobaculum sp. SPO524]|uniref:RnfABCDGE type electron transport complex subunit D n=1 Tax=Desulfobaculum sp. SPO524 TaxID=3378071 RepID=UPI0038545CB1
MTPPVIKPLAQSAGALSVTPAPHWRLGMGVKNLSLTSLAALAPAAVMAVMTYGLDAARIMALAGAVAVLVEALCLRLMARDVDVDNFSALYAGVLFAFLLPAGAPWWLVAAGAAMTVALGRAVFGGYGANPLCAPLVAWAMCRVSWPAFMDIDMTMPMSVLNEPLAQLKYFGLDAVQYQYNLTDFLFGNALGALGASQVLALVIGGAFLLWRGVIRWHIPAAFIVGVMAMAQVFHMVHPDMAAGPLFHVLTGSVVFGAFFLATDHASSPAGRVPQLLYGFIGGALVMVIREYGVYPDGVPFAILLANLLSPLLDRVRPKPFGG